ncbi:MAG: hypothetical protein GDA67_00740 [Nitrospira sp. CR1.3]|nr:hypothetical protein [Nitrospira sp. CR1.3]
MGSSVHRRIWGKVQLPFRLFWGPIRGSCRGKQPHRAHSTHPPVGPFRCARWGAPFATPPASGVDVDKLLATRKNHNSTCVEGEDEMANLAEVIKGAMSLDVRDRATLAEKLLASFEELSEEEADRLWAEESQRRLDQYRAGQAKAVSADAVHEKVNKLLR